MVKAAGSNPESWRSWVRDLLPPTLRVSGELGDLSTSGTTAQAADMVADQVLIPGAVYGNGGMSELQYATTLSNLPGFPRQHDWAAPRGPRSIRIANPSQICALLA